MKTDKDDMVRLLSRTNQRVVEPYCGTLKSEIDALVAHVERCFDHEGNLERDPDSLEPYTSMSWDDLLDLKKVQYALRILEGICSSYP